MTLTTTTEQYPNGTTYLKILIDGRRIGHVDIVDGGYRDLYMRRSRPTVRQAAIDILKRDVKQLRQKLAEAQGWLTELERTP